MECARRLIDYDLYPTLIEKNKTSNKYYDAIDTKLVFRYLILNCFSALL